MPPNAPDKSAQSDQDAGPQQPTRAKTGRWWLGNVLIVGGILAVFVGTFGNIYARNRFDGRIFYLAAVMVVCGLWFRFRRPPNPAKSRVGILVPLYVAVGMYFVGGEIISLSLRPLDDLNIPYPRILRYAHLIIPVVMLALCLIFNRSNRIAIVAVLATATILPGIARWADNQPVKIPVTRVPDSYAFDAWQQQLGFKMLGRGDANGDEIWVDRTPGRAQRVAEEVKRMGIARP